MRSRSSEKRLLLLVLVAGMLLSQVSAGAASSVDEYIAILESDDTRAKVDVCRLLAEMGPKAASAVPALVAILADSGDHLAVGWGSGEGGSPFGVLVSDEASEVDLTQPVSEALVSIGVSAIPHLIRAAEDDASLMNQARLKYLAIVVDIGGPEAVSGLVRLVRDGDRGLRVAAIRSLGKLGPSAGSAVPFLGEMMEEQSADVGREIISALVAIGPDSAVMLQNGLKARDYAIRMDSVEALGELGVVSPDIVSSLIEAVFDENWRVREASIQVLGRMGMEAEAAVPALVRALRDEEWRVRHAAVVSLESIDKGTDTVINALREVLYGDEKADVRSTAAIALARSMGASGLDILLAAVRCDDPDTRASAASGLGEATLDLDATVPALVEAMRDPERTVRMSSASALKRRGSVVTPYLEPALTDGCADVRKRTVQLLGDMGEDAMPLLATALRDEDRTIRWLAAQALGRLASRESIPYLADSLNDEEVSVRQMALWSLCQIGADAVPYMLEALRTQPRVVYIEVTKKLSEMGSEGFEALLEALEDDNLFVRQAAAEALQSMGPGAKEAVPALLEALDDSSFQVRQVAAEALCEIGPAAMDVDADIIQKLVDKMNYEKHIGVTPVLERAARAIRGR